MRKGFWVFVTLVVISPWFVILVSNSSMIFPLQERLVSIQNDIFLDKVNNLRGETINAGFALLGKLMVNKYFYFGKEIINRYLESYDPHYLFFSGEANLLKSTLAAGPLYLTFLPLILYGVFRVSIGRNKKLKLIFYLLGFSAIPAAFVYTHYETVVRIPFFLVLTLFAAYGLVKLFSSKRALALLFAFLIIFETLRFYHDFKVHYPRRLGENLYSIPKK